MRLRYSLILFVATAILLTISSTVLYQYYKNNVLESMDLRIYTWANDLVVEVVKNPAHFYKAPNEFLTHPKASEFISSSTIVQFMGKNGKLLAKSPSLKYEELPFYPGEDDVLRDVEMDDGTGIKVYQRAIDLEGETIGYVIVAAPTLSLYRNLDTLRGAIFIVMLSTFLILGFMINSLVSMNIVDRQRKFLAFASHELRTPLSVIAGVRMWLCLARKVRKN